ncbi:MAG: glycosyltransferase family 2 protein [Campylobacterales bacterium]
MSQSKTLPLSVAVITLNEEANLARCLESVRALRPAEIVVVDSGSTDKTAEIAARFGARFEHNDWPGHVKQKNHAFSQCVQPWVLSLDADECLTPELAESILRLFENGEPNRDGYWLNRRTWYLGEWIWHAWYPEWRLRLVRREKARWVGTDPHDKLEVDGATARLTGGDFLHYSYSDLTDHLHRMQKYAQIAARAEAAKGKPFRWTKLLFSPPGRLFKSLFIKGAWRDGWRGVVIAFSDATSAFMKYAYMYENSLREENKSK